MEKDIWHIKEQAHEHEFFEKKNKQALKKLVEKLQVGSVDENIPKSNLHDGSASHSAPTPHHVSTSGNRGS